MPLLTTNPLVNASFRVLQNQDTSPLFVKAGTGASSSDCDFILAGCTAAKDGAGGTVSMLAQNQNFSFYSAGTVSYSIF